MGVPMEASWDAAAKVLLLEEPHAEANGSSSSVTKARPGSATHGSGRGFAGGQGGRGRGRGRGEGGSTHDHDRASDASRGPAVPVPEPPPCPSLQEWLAELPGLANPHSILPTSLPLQVRGCNGLQVHLLCVAAPGSICCVDAPGSGLTCLVMLLSQRGGGTHLLTHLFCHTALRGGPPYTLLLLLLLQVKLFAHLPVLLSSAIKPGQLSEVVGKLYLDLPGLPEAVTRLTAATAAAT